MLNLLNRGILFLKKKNWLNSSFKYIGSDLDDPVGSFYRRKVEYAQRRKPFEYSETDLPVQWRSWLSHTRPDPPTIEELQSAKETLQRLEDKVKLLNKHSALPNAAFTPESWKPPGKQ